MDRHEKLAKYSERTLKILERKALNAGLLDKGERLSLLISTPEPIALGEQVSPHIRPDEFFSQKRLMTAGAPAHIAARVETCVRVAMYSWKRGKTLEFDTLEKFLAKHVSRGRILIANIGPTSTPHMVKVLKLAGIEGVEG